MKRVRDYLITILIAFLLPSALWGASSEAYSVTDLTYQNTSWAAETGAAAVCQPERNSFGYVFISEGRMLNAINQNGTILWQKQVSERIQPFLTSIPGDLFFAVFSRSKLTLINPSLIYVWQQDTGFEVIEKPLLGFDGRVYARGSENINCYSLKGNLRWTLKLTGQNTALPLTSFNDGSLLVFVNSTYSASLNNGKPKRNSEIFGKKQNNTSARISSVNGEYKAVRISPFGEILEDITFNSQPKELCCTKKGIVISFADGRCSLISVKDRSVYEAWRFSQYTTESKLYAMENETDLLLINGNPAVINLISLADGKVKKTSAYTDLSPAKNLIHVDETAGGTVLCFKDNAICINYGLKIQWQAIYNKQKKCRYAFSTDYGYLVMCTDDWVVEAFRMVQSFQKSKYTYKPRELEPYTVKFNKNSPLYSVEMNYFEKHYDELLKSYRKESLGAKEEEFYLDLNNQFADFITVNESAHEYTAQQIFLKNDINEVSAVLDLLAQSGSFTQWKEYAYLMKQLEDPTLILMLVKTAGIIAYDPDGKLLNALESLCHSWPDKKDQIFFNSICDSVYQICAFMGRPTFFATGESILSYLLSNHFSPSINAYARDTLKKVITLKL